MKNNLIGIIFLFMSIVAFLIAGYVVKPAFDLVTQGITTTAKVVDIEIHGRRNIPFVEFTDVAGNTHTELLEISFSPYVTYVGDTIPIAYFPRDPDSTVRLNHFWSHYGLSFFFVFLGFMWLVAGLLYGKHLFLPIKRKHSRMVTEAETQSAYVQRTIAKYVEGGTLTSKEKNDPRIQALIGPPMRKLFGMEVISMVGATLMLCVGVIVLNLGITWRTERIQLIENSLDVPGTVIEQVSSERRTSTTYYYWVEYKTSDGLEFSVLTEGFNSRDKYQTGETLKVLIPRGSNGNPSEVEVITDAYYSRPNIIVFIGAAFLVASLLMFALARAGGEIVMPWAKGKPR